MYQVHNQEWLSIGYVSQSRELYVITAKWRLSLVDLRKFITSYKQSK